MKQLFHFKNIYRFDYTKYIFFTEQIGWSDNRGGWLLVTLHDVFKNRIREQQRFSLMVALHEVNRMVSLRSSNTLGSPLSGMKSIPCMEYKLTKEIYFEPVIAPAFYA